MSAAVSIPWTPPNQRIEDPWLPLTTAGNRRSQNGPHDEAVQCIIIELQPRGWSADGINEHKVHFWQWVVEYTGRWSQRLAPATRHRHIYVDSGFPLTPNHRALYDRQ